MLQRLLESKFWFWSFFLGLLIFYFWRKKNPQASFGILFDFQEELTLRNLWASGYNVIVSYEHNICSCHGDLWPHIPYWWANKCKAEALIEDFEHRKQHGRPGTEVHPTRSTGAPLDSFCCPQRSHVGWAHF